MNIFARLRALLGRRPRIGPPPGSREGDAGSPRSFPQSRTALLVIHGIGEQNPFDTIDAFSRGLIDYFRAEGVSFSPTHRIAARKGMTGARWTESYARFAPPRGDDFIDVHEYYWAFLTEKKIRAGEVADWIEKTIDSMKCCAKENLEIRRREEGLGKPYWFRLLRVAKFLFWLAPLFDILASLPYWQLLGPLRRWVKKRGLAIVIDYIGDVAIYTTTDQKSHHYRIRQAILAEAQTLLESILREKQYERVVVVGHSLGSVIAYDTLNRLNLKANLPDGDGLPLHKIAGLVTFGSPLDKIAFFFHQHVHEDQYVRAAIIEGLRSFKAKPLRGPGDGAVPKSTVEAKLDGVRWVNYFDANDPISGHLDFYKIDEGGNVELHLDDAWGAAHVGYWDHRPMYADIARRFL